MVRVSPGNRTSATVRVASAAGAGARSSDAGDAGHRTGAATKLQPGAAATLWAAGIWPDSFVARRQRRRASISFSCLGLEPNRGGAVPRDFCPGLIGMATVPIPTTFGEG